MVAVVLCLAVDSYFIYSVLETHKKLKHNMSYAKFANSHFDIKLPVLEKQTKQYAYSTGHFVLHDFLSILKQ